MMFIEQVIVTLLMELELLDVLLVVVAFMMWVLLSQNCFPIFTEPSTPTSPIIIEFHNVHMRFFIICAT